MIGPRPMPIPLTPAQTPMARPRSRGSVKMLVMIDNVAGMMNARADAHDAAGDDRAA